MSRKTEKTKTYRSRMTGRLLLQYILTLSGYIVGIIFLAYLGWQFCRMFIWQPEDPLYRILYFIREHFLGVVGFLILIGWLIITGYYILKPLRFLDEVIAASERLASPSQEPVRLSPEMGHVQNDLNLVREKALNDARAARLAEQRKNDLVMYLAHDLKTPLSSVLGYLTLLRDEPQISEKMRQQYLSITLDKAERLEDLINEFFEITRFNLSNITLEYGQINLTRMLEQLVFEFQPMLLEKDLKCELKAPRDISIKCDGDKLQRVFDNLLRNALFYSYRGTTISVTAELKGEKVFLSFTNEGNTIPAEKLERIFEQFYRLDTARSSSSGGAGLGLAIAKEIVELHQGRIAAHSEDGKICFEVTLPLF